MTVKNNGVMDGVTDCDSTEYYSHKLVKYRGPDKWE